MLYWHKAQVKVVGSNNTEAEKQEVCFSWANSRGGTQTTTAVTVNRAQGAGAASQPTGLMADCVGRRVSALSYHNTVWHTWTTVTSVNTNRLPHCLAGRQIMRPVFALDVWFNVPLFVIGFRTQERKRDQRRNATICVLFCISCSMVGEGAIEKG